VETSIADVSSRDDSVGKKLFFWEIHDDFLTTLELDVFLIFTFHLRNCLHPNHIHRFGLLVGRRKDRRKTNLNDHDIKPCFQLKAALK
jgi:hypothetical protein